MQYVELKSLKRKWFTANKVIQGNLIAYVARAKRTDA